MGYEALITAIEKVYGDRLPAEVAADVQLLRAISEAEAAERAERIAARKAKREATGGTWAD